MFNAVDEFDSMKGQPCSVVCVVLSNISIPSAPVPLPLSVSFPNCNAD